MALGGGNWTHQGKNLPGVYINFISKSKPKNSTVAILGSCQLGTAKL